MMVDIPHYILVLLFTVYEWRHQDQVQNSFFTPNKSIDWYIHKSILFLSVLRMATWLAWGKLAWTLLQRHLPILMVQSYSATSTIRPYVTKGPEQLVAKSSCMLVHRLLHSGNIWELMFASSRWGWQRTHWKDLRAIWPWTLHQCGWYVSTTILA